MEREEVAGSGGNLMDRVIFINVAWMSRYAGLNGDQIASSHGYVKSHGFGHEMFNFAPIGRKMYGTAPFPHGSVNVQKLDALKGDDSASGVLVVWVARSVIVGWYKNATVYRHSQVPPKGNGHSYKGKPIGYRAVAAEQDCKLILPPDARVFPVPRAWQRKHAMGRYTWFAEGEPNRAFREKVGKYITAEGDISAVKVSRRQPRKSAVAPHQPDPQKRTQVERAAVDRVTKYFESMKYDVSDVGRDNLGWDLNAHHRVTGSDLKLEVKGLSGSGSIVELTPNEYAMMSKHRGNYRICVARGCLDRKPELAVFAYNEAADSWTDESDRPLRIKRMTAARLQLP
jgi:hypothetical protein